MKATKKEVNLFVIRMKIKKERIRRKKGYEKLRNETNLIIIRLSKCVNN